MIRGSTPTHTFNIPIDGSIIDKLEIVYHQGENMVTKTEEDCEIYKEIVKVKLSQDDTLSFQNTSRSVRVQMRIKTTSGDVLISDISTLSVEECLFQGVI